MASTGLLTTKAILVYTWIVNFKQENDGNSPSYREIAEGMGYKSTSPVYYQLQRLQDAGYVDLSDGRISLGGRWRPPREMGV